MTRLPLIAALASLTALAVTLTPFAIGAGLRISVGE